MKNNTLILGLMLLAGVLTIVPSSYAEEIAVIKDIQGEVLVQNAGADATAWTPVSGTVSVQNGDTIQTKEGTCSLVYGEKGTVQVQANTMIVVKEGPETQDIALKLGRIRCQIDALKPGKTYQISTPVAVSAIRGTDVDFGFGADGGLTIDLHDGKVQTMDDDKGLDLNLEGGNKITIYYDPATRSIRLKNDCASERPVTFTFSGIEYSTNPCDETTTAPGTAGGDVESPDTPGDNPETEVDDDDDDDNDVPPPATTTGGEESLE